MSNNHNKPRFSIPAFTPPPPPITAPPVGAIKGLPQAIAALLERFPLPWVAGPHGDIWVAADVEQFDPDKEGGHEKVAGPNGSWWRSTCAKPRLVMENPADNGIAALIVFAANNLAPKGN